MLARRLFQVCGAVVSLGVASAAYGNNFEVVAYDDSSDWAVIKLESGCHWLAYGVNLTGDAGLTAIVWSGGCNANGFIEGDGYIGLQATVYDIAGERRYSATFVDGVPDGEGSISDWAVGWSTGEHEPYQGADVSYNQGCMGQDGCDPEVGKGLREFVVAQNVGPNAAQSASDAGNSSASPSAPKQPAEGINATGCLAMDPKPDARGEAILRNTCDFVVNFAHCFLDPTPLAMLGVGACTTQYTQYSGVWFMLPRNTRSYGKADTFKSLPVFGCQDPAKPVNVTWVNGGLSGKCEIPE